MTLMQSAFARPTIYTQRTHEPDVTPYLGWNTEGEIGHFLDCIEDGTEPLTHADEALKSLQIIWRLYADNPGQL